MCIETDRLLLRKFNVNDAKSMYENWTSDEEVTKYLTWNAHTSVEQTKHILNIWIKEYEKPNTYRYAIVLKETNELIGSIDVVGYVDGCPEIGYCLSRKHWNNGYMSEAIKAFINFLFDKNFNKIVIEANVNNIASNKVITKCGFKFTHIEEKEHCSIFKLEPVVVNWYEIK